MRKATLYAARSGSDRVVDSHFGDALALLERGGRVTRAMLGADGGVAVSELPDEDDDEWDQ